MLTESVSLSFLSIVLLVGFFVCLITKNFSNRIGDGALLDQEFEKPQAFHKEAVARSGGLAAIISLVIFLFCIIFCLKRY